MRIQQSLLCPDTVIELVSTGAASPSPSPTPPSTPRSAAKRRRTNSSTAALATPAPSSSPTAAALPISTPGCRSVPGAYDGLSAGHAFRPRGRYVRFAALPAHARQRLDGLDYDADSDDEAFVAAFSRGRKRARGGLTLDCLEAAMQALERVAHVVQERRRAQTAQRRVYLDLRHQRRAVMSVLRDYAGTLQPAAPDATRRSGRLDSLPPPPSTCRWPVTARIASAVERACGPPRSPALPSQVGRAWSVAVAAASASAAATKAAKARAEEAAMVAVLSSDVDEEGLPAAHVAPLPGGGDLTDSDGDVADTDRPPSPSQASEAETEPWDISAQQAAAALQASGLDLGASELEAVLQHWRSQRHANGGAPLLRAYQSLSMGDHGVGVGGDDESDAVTDASLPELAPSSALGGLPGEDADPQAADADIAEAVTLATELRRLKRLRQSFETARMLVDVSRRRERIRRDVVRNAAALRLLGLAGGDVDVQDVLPLSPGGDEPDVPGAPGGARTPLADHTPRSPPPQRTGSGRAGNSRHQQSLKASRSPSSSPAGVKTPQPRLPRSSHRQAPPRTPSPSKPRASRCAIM